MGWMQGAWSRYRANPARWIGAGICIWLSLLVPRFLTSLFRAAVEGRIVSIDDLLAPQRMAGQVVLTAFYWSVMLGVLTMAIREKRGNGNTVGDFVGGFFGGFFVLPAAILWEYKQPESLQLRLALVGASVLIWPFVSAAFWMLASRTKRGEMKAIFKQTARRYPQLLAMEVVSALLLAVGWLTGGLLIILFGPLRLLAISEAFSPGDSRAA